MPTQLAVTVSLTYNDLIGPGPNRQIRPKTVCTSLEPLDKLADNRCLVTEASFVVEDELALVLVHDPYPGPRGGGGTPKKNG